MYGGNHYPFLFPFISHYFYVHVCPKLELDNLFKGRKMASALRNAPVPSYYSL